MNPIAPTPRSRVARRAPALLSVLALAGCGLGAPAATDSTAAALVTSTPALRAAQVQTLAAKLHVPWGLDFLPDGGALVTERDKRRILKLGPEADGAGLKVTPVQEVPESDTAGGEGGLLGLVVSPRYATDKTVYLYYTTARDNRIAALTLGGRPRPIVTGIPKDGNHNGGRLHFGPDGFLYASTGDAEERTHSQDLKSLGGKILRMTSEGRPAPGNPFGDSLVYSYGHRNVQGFAWDAAGRLYATEFGANTWDELNRVEPGRNYGWPIVEGTGKDPKYTNPLLTYPTRESSCSGAAVVGDTFYAGCLQGKNVLATKLTADGGVAGPSVGMLTGYGRVRTAARAPDGALWLTTSNRDGRGRPTAEDDRVLRVPAPVQD